MKLTKIDANLSIFKQNKVVIYGTDFRAVSLIKLFKFFDIEVHAFFNEDEIVSRYIKGIPVYGKLNMREFANQNDVLIQMGILAESFKLLAIPSSENLLEKNIRKLGEFSIKDVISYEETTNILYTYKDLILNERSIEQGKEYYKVDALENLVLDRRKMLHDHIIQYSNNSILLGCLPPKTGDNTLRNTFLKHNINFYNFSHYTHLFDLNSLTSCCENIKLITAVRDPISQNLSAFFEMISNLYRSTNYDNFFIDSENYILFMQDTQLTFDRYLYGNKYLKTSFEIDYPQTMIEIQLIQNFIPNFQKNIIDILSYPFDKEKGYTIIKEENLEIFVYQLEKMNDIVEEMSEWIGEEQFDEWVKGNEASNKWVADSYKQAQKELIFTQEYFDKCYNEPYVKYFYSERDVEKFKARWSDNVK